LEKERKQQIIRAAIKRFSKHGIKKTTLEEIARDLRIGKATIYHYFSSKEELYFECLLLETTQFIEEIRNIFNGENILPGQKFLDYFNLKENTKEKFKLIYTFLVAEITENLFENEKNMLGKFFNDENDLVKAFINSVNKNKSEQQAADFSNFIVNQSWALLFASQLSGIFNNENIAEQKELLVKLLENNLN